MCGDSPLHEIIITHIIIISKVAIITIIHKYVPEISLIQFNQYRLEKNVEQSGCQIIELLLATLLCNYPMSEQICECPGILEFVTTFSNPHNKMATKIVRALLRRAVIISVFINCF